MRLSRLESTVWRERRKGIWAAAGLRITLFCLFVGLFAETRAFALDPRTPLQRYARQIWSTENGLPQNSVHALLQSRDGFLWVGTEAGLARFDGYQFKVFDRSSAPALPGDDIRCLLEDRTGGLWVGTASGLTLFMNGQEKMFASANGLPTGAVKALLQGQDGRVWVLTAGGLAYANAASRSNAGTEFSQLAGLDSETVLSILADGGDGLWIATTQGLRHLTHGQLQASRSVFAGSRIDAMAQGPGEKDGLVVSTPLGLFRLEEGKWTSLTSAASAPAEGVRSLLETSEGVWAAGRNSVTFLRAVQSATLTGQTMSHKVQGEVFAAGAALPGTQITAMLRDRGGAVWIGTNGGIARYLNGKMERITEPDDAVLSLFEDRDGDLWEGTETEGVRVLRDRAFQALSPEIRSFDASPTSVVQTGDGSVWIGSNGAGLFKADRSSNGAKSYTQRDGLVGDTVLALAPGKSAQDVWAGTPDGLSLFHDGTWRSFTSADGLADDLVRSILPTRDGSLLIGTPHGLTRLRDGHATTITANQEAGQGLGSSLIGPMLETQGGDIWIGTFGGLSLLRDGAFHNFTVADGLPGNTITALALSAGGGLWVGTKGQGLARWGRAPNNGAPNKGAPNNRTQSIGAPEESIKFSSFAAARSIPAEIYALLDDNAGSLWMTSEHGIFRVSVRDLDEMLGNSSGGSKSEVPVISYGTADGLPSVDTTATGYPSAWRLSDGRLCFVTRRGVVVTDPQGTRKDEAPPAVLEEVMVDDRAVTPQELASMAPGPLHFAFTFAGINLSVPQRVEYKYWLEGLDKGWVYAGARRVAYYTNIPPGHYRFRVSARNELGAWSAPAEVWFELRPHFYQTMWFRALLVLMAILAGLGVYVVRVRTLRHRFNLVSAERNRLAREIHDTLAQSFVAVSMRLEVMGQMLKTNEGVERCREQLNQTRTLVRDSLEEARRSIWDLRSEGADAQALPARLARMVQNAAVTIPGTRLETTGTFRPLDRRLEDELFRIAQEAVANAVRHAGAQSIRVRLEYALDALSLEVIDNGRGFDPDAVPQGAGHFGLIGIRERGGLIGAEVMLTSRHGAGTEVRVAMPLNRQPETAKGRT